MFSRPFVIFVLFFLEIAVFSLASSVEHCEVDDNGNSLCQRTPKGANAQGEPLRGSLSDDCRDRHQQCVMYANEGECSANPGWMTINCPFSCNACHLRNPALRCDRTFLNISTEPIYSPNHMNLMFRRLTTMLSERYKVNVVSTDPWVVTMDDFLSNEEIDAILESVGDKWERSTDTGKSNEFGETGRVLSRSRTSMNAWCRGDCEHHPLVHDVTARIEEITMIPSSHYENFQILRYDVGQYYYAHNDMSPYQATLACGPRILTFFLYLSDVEEGGETAFPSLNIAVRPKRGMALMWPSTLNENPLIQDSRMAHEARPVIRGRKYAANAWIHLYDFKIPNLWACTGTVDVL